MKTCTVMRSFHVLAASIVVALAVRPASAAEIFKSVDAQGRAIYSDRPPPGTSERIYIPGASRSSDESRERAAAELAELKRRETEREEERSLQKQKKTQNEEALRAQEQRCEQARNRFLTFSEANRLYRRDARGERVYYTGPEIDVEREKARQEMQVNCTQ